MVALLGGVFLGWSLGANHAANCFGSAVASRMVRFRTAAGLCAAGVVLGALLDGQAGIATLSGLTSIDLEQAVAITVAVALAVSAMTWFNLPVSTSQGVVGAILGIGFLNQQINLAVLEKVFICWVGTPFCAIAAACALYKILAYFYNRLTISIFRADSLLRIGLVVAGSYASYTLGANNVANATAVFVGAGMLTVFQAALIGGLSIAFGVLTYSRRVMETVGDKLVRLDPFSALAVVLAEGLTVHFYTLLGVPVSTSQAVVGAVLGKRGRHHQTQDALRHSGRLVPDAVGRLLHRHVHLLRHPPAVRSQVNDGLAGRLTPLAACAGHREIRVA